jgi:hypothetical protein
MAVNGEVAHCAQPQAELATRDMLRAHEPYAMFFSQTAWRTAFGLDAQQRHLSTLT